MKTFLNLTVPLWLLLVAGLLFGGWMIRSGVKHSRQVNKMQTRFDSLATVATDLQSENEALQDREVRVAQETSRRQELEQYRIREVRDSLTRLRLTAQTRYVQQVSGAAPELPAYLLPAVSPKMTVSLRVCYDSTAYIRITQSMGELNYYRETNRLRIERQVRTDGVIQETDNRLSRIEEPGWFRGRRRLAREARKRIRIWAAREQTIQDSIRGAPVN
ncbi:hypothetical protein [Arsenicibacter rosenii]|uniref:Uncharacterized protein n=1 Tax=Arsenicibacter rosenii TaxID=1750698 RepID=A0A1S2VBG7_9BACT|nr:hypothetical protein [Arsenicibacter rosenii]OIN55655.1 hypothetical protein BLX24_28890 [Arsenicibacter rosenii]